MGGRRPIVGGDKFAAKKISNKKYTVTLGGRRSINTQQSTRSWRPRYNGCWRGGARGLEHVGGRRPIVEGDEFDAKKISNKKYTAALGGRWSINLITTTYQKQAPIMEESKDR